MTDTYEGLEEKSGVPQEGRATAADAVEPVPVSSKADTPNAVFSADLLAMQAWAEGIIASRPQDFVIGANYIRRWWVLPRNEFCNVYLHEMLHSDEGRALHDHPWANTSFLLSGSYIEHTPEGLFERKAGDVVRREANSLHRLELVGDRAISLFSTGPKEREWGFACGHGWVHWRDFVDVRDTGQVGRGCGEHDDLAPITSIGGSRPAKEIEAREGQDAKQA